MSRPPDAYGGTAEAVNAEQGSDDVRVLCVVQPPSVEPSAPTQHNNQTVFQAANIACILSLNTLLLTATSLFLCSFSSSCTEPVT